MVNSSVGRGLVAASHDRRLSQHDAAVMQYGTERMRRTAARLIAQPTALGLAVDGHTGAPTRG